MKSTSAVVVLLFLLFVQPAFPQWVQTNGPSSGQVECLAVHGGNIFAGSGGYGVYLSTDNGGSWDNFSNILGDKSVMALAIVGDTIFAASQYNGVYISTDSAVTWTAVNAGISNYAMQAFALLDTFIFAGTKNVGIYRSSIHTILWDTVNAGLTNHDVTSLTACQGNLFAGTNGGGAFWSTDKGISWSSANDGLPDSYVTSLASAGDLIYAGTFTNGVFRAGGGNVLVEWVKWTSGLTGSSSVNALVATGLNAFAGTQQEGVLLSTNSGADWTSVVTSSLTNLHVLALAMSATDIYAGTLGGGVFRRPLGQLITGVERMGSERPTEYRLSQNYPNPFNPRTRIQLTIADRQWTIVNVYDMLGRKVANLMDGVKDPGTYSVDFDASNFPSGVYIYRLQSGSFVESKKLIVLK